MTSGYLPVTKTAQNNEVYVNNFLSKADGTKNGIAATATKQAISQNDAYFTSEVFIGSSYARDEVGSLVSSLMQDKAAVTDELVQSYFTKAIKNCKYQAGQ